MARRRGGDERRQRGGRMVRPALVLVFLAGVVLFVLGLSHLHDGTVAHAADWMIVGICLIVLAPITYVLRGGRGAS
jgi:hypothetical protein